MTTPELLEELQRSDVHLKARGHILRVECPEGALDDAAHAVLRAHKPELLVLLTEAQWRAREETTLLQGLLSAAGMSQVAEIELRCRPAVAWMEAAGVSFDAAAWVSLAREAAEEAQRIRAGLDAAAADLLGDHVVMVGRWDDAASVRQLFTRMGVPITDTSDAGLAAVEHPVADRLRVYRKATGRARNYSERWLDYVENGRLYPQWKQMGAPTGRMSCSHPPLQSVPRDTRYRSCFTAPPGRVLVKADYHQVELLIAAVFAGEKTMLDAYARNIDLHRLTASLILKKPVAEVCDAERQLAKAINFGLVYGMGAPKLRTYALKSFGVTMALEEAAQYRCDFLSSFPALRLWQERAAREVTRETRTLAGRCRILWEDAAAGDASLFTQRLNTPVQGSCADALKSALSYLWERRDASTGAVPVLALHDELVIECDAAHAEQAAAWLKGAMQDGMRPFTAPVSVVVEVQVGPTWAGKEAGE